jgi:hypothetical protein
MTTTTTETNTMPFPVIIQHGSHNASVRVYALPRSGDRMNCAFPSSGIPPLHLVVERVYFREPSDPAEPFAIVVMTEGDPDPTLKAANERVFRDLVSGKQSNA